MNDEPLDAHTPSATPPPISASPPLQVALASTDLAPFSSRLIAVLIDWAVMFVAMVIMARILPGFASVLLWLLPVAYIIARDSLSFLGGQSIGKKAMKIKVVTLDGQSIVNNWEAALRRNGALVVPIFAVVELIVILTRDDKPERGRRLGDEWANTKVISCNPPLV